MKNKVLFLSMLMLLSISQMSQPAFINMAKNALNKMAIPTITGAIGGYCYGISAERQRAEQQRIEAILLSMQAQSPKAIEAAILLSMQAQSPKAKDTVFTEQNAEKIIFSRLGLCILQHIGRSIIDECLQGLPLYGLCKTL
ncbi:hypothetical protein A3J41_03565 [candidate division TM6 bacterium RIFCSPHIGHO2_12_FULL_38_8]|nr:MAG: hypothetical protein A3J41_03565 [candidate division TM6 bacterium RIFCSPHIGHO2_12_FULL_38_8]